MAAVAVVHADHHVWGVSDQVQTVVFGRADEVTHDALQTVESEHRHETTSDGLLSRIGNLDTFGELQPVDLISHVAEHLGAPSVMAAVVVSMVLPAFCCVLWWVLLVELSVGLTVNPCDEIGVLDGVGQP